MSGNKSSVSGSVPSLGYETVRTNGSSSVMDYADSSDESDDGDEERFLWGWDPSDKAGIKLEECEKVLQALEDVAMAKFRHGKRWDASGNKGT